MGGGLSVYEERIRAARSWAAFSEAAFSQRCDVIPKPPTRPSGFAG